MMKKDEAAQRAPLSFFFLFFFTSPFDD